jgi:UDP-2,3-diacylglucosamine pyrophosphatase LpxH
MQNAVRKYYFVSDLHMGGDGQLQQCDYTAEFIAFLKQLEKEGPDTELLIVGDTFGFWELTLVRGTDKLDHIIAAHQAIFDQLHATGARIKITMMVGNHDYDLACNAEFVAKLQQYNIHLDTSLVLIRAVGDKKIWIEHGQQRDEFNAFPDYGSPYALPVGYFITQTFVSGASRHSDFGRGNWLKDIRSVDTMQIPDWVLSNYFYREMSAVLRWVLLPFLLLAGLTMVAIAGELLRVVGIYDYNILFHAHEQAWDHQQCPSSGDRDQFDLPGAVRRSSSGSSARPQTNSHSVSPPHRLRNNSKPRFPGMLFESGSASVPSRRQSGGIRLWTHPHGVSKTTGTSRSGGPEHGNLAEAPTPRPSPLWSIARGLLSLVSPQLFLHRKGKQPSRDHLRGCPQSA